MPKHKPSEQSTNFYLEELCGRADEVYRFAYLLTLRLDMAARCVDATFTRCLNELGSIMASDHVTQALLHNCWLAFGELASKASAQADSAFTKSLSALSLEERAVLGAVDMWGVPQADVSKAFGWDKAQGSKHLASARQKLCGLGLEQLGETRQKGAKS